MMSMTGGILTASEASGKGQFRRAGLPPGPGLTPPELATINSATGARDDFPIDDT